MGFKDFYFLSEATFYGKELMEKPKYVEPLANKIFNGETINVVIKKEKKGVKIKNEFRDKTELIKYLSNTQNPEFKTEDGKTVSLTKIDKSLFSQKSDAPTDAKQTVKQEYAFMEAIKLAFEDRVYEDYDEFKSVIDEKIQKVYPDITEDWYRGIYLAHKSVVEKFGNLSFGHYSRDVGFMSFITKLVKDKFNVSKKDVWYPADIWLVKNLESVKKILLDVSEIGSITYFNEVLKRMFKDNDVIGISLKKISGKKAKIEIVNVDNVMFKGKDYNLELDSIRLPLDIKKESFSTKDSNIFVKEHGKIYAKIQLKRNSGEISNLKFEGTSKSSTKARLGKAPIDMLLATINQYTPNTFNNKHKDYPKNYDDYIKNEKKFLDMYSVVSRNKIVDTRINNVKDFSNNMKKMYKIDPNLCNAKLMMLHFFYTILQIKNKEELDNFITEVIFLCMKSGDKFGPFAKLY